MIEARTIHPAEWGYFREQVLPFYERGLAPAADDWTVEEAERAFLSGEHVLYAVFEDGILRTIAQGQFVYYPRNTTFLVLLAAGKIQDYDIAVNKLGDLVRAGGASALEAWCRPSMARFLRRFGFIERHRVVRKPL